MQPPLDITLRLAHRSEAGVIAGLSRLHVEYGLRWRWTPGRVRRSILDTETTVLLATSRGEPVGFSIMKFGERDAHLLLFAVEPKHRRNGIGRAMIDWLERSCRTAGMLGVRIEVRADNRRALAFYEILGYRRAGEIPAYYDGSEAAVVLTKNLRSGQAQPRSDGPPRTLIDRMSRTASAGHWNQAPARCA